VAYRFYCPDLVGRIEAETIRDAMNQLASHLSIEGQIALTAYEGTLTEPAHPLIHVSIGDRYPDWWTDKHGRLRSE
jgi:hypothetical protein